MLKRSHRYAVPLVLTSFINSLAIYQVEAGKLAEADAQLVRLIEDLNRQRLAPQPVDGQERGANEVAADGRRELVCRPERARATPGGGAREAEPK